jgi:hypothetical protein
MSPTKSPFDRLLPAFRRASSRLRGGHAVALSVVAAASFGLAGLRAVELPAPRPIDDNDRLRIEVVHPVEPDIVPGSVMDVGELVDGFQGLPPPLAALTDVRWSYDDGAPDRGAAWAPPPVEPRRAADTRTWESRPEPDRSSPVRAVQRWFGFDEPRRDFQAERAARRARMEAMERDARERHARERYAADRFRRERAEAERYAAESLRRERADADRYAWDRRRDEARYAPGGREDRLRERGPDRPPPLAPPEAAFDHVSVPPPPGPRPYSDWGR